MKSTNLSVVIPVYNGGDFIEETIESVLHHSVGLDVDCVVIDDGSTDNTPEILRKFSGKIRLFSQANSGESAAVNLGLTQAVGNYVVVISADDPVFTRDFFLDVINFFESNPSAVAWFPDWQIIDQSGKVLKTIYPPDYSFREMFANNNVLPGPGTWFRREAALKIHGRRPKWKYVGDFDFWLRLSLCGDLVNRRKIVAQWRKHPRSTSISARGLDMAKERIGVIEDFIAENGNLVPTELISLGKAKSYYLAAKLGFFSKEVNSRKLFISAIRLNPKVLKTGRFHEYIFMALFPASKILVDLVLRMWSKNEK